MNKYLFINKHRYYVVRKDVGTLYYSLIRLRDRETLKPELPPGSCACHLFVYLCIYDISVPHYSRISFDFTQIFCVTDLHTPPNPYHIWLTRFSQEKLLYKLFFRLTRLNRCTERPPSYKVGSLTVGVHLKETDWHKHHFHPPPPPGPRLNTHYGPM